MQQGDPNFKSVEKVQQALQWIGFLQEPPNGSFGPSTCAAVTAFKTARELYPNDPVVGPKTAAQLDKEITGRSQDRPAVSQHEPWAYSEFIQMEPDVTTGNSDVIGATGTMRFSEWKIGDLKSGVSLSLPIHRMIDFAVKAGTVELTSPSATGSRRYTKNFFGVGPKVNVNVLQRALGDKIYKNFQPYIDPICKLNVPSSTIIQQNAVAILNKSSGELVSSDFDGLCMVFHAKASLGMANTALAQGFFGCGWWTALAGPILGDLVFGDPKAMALYAHSSIGLPTPNAELATTFGYVGDDDMPEILKAFFRKLIS